MHKIFERLSEPPAERFVRNVIVAGELQKDLERFSHFVEVDLAHVVMLADQKILKDNEALKILKTLVMMRKLKPEQFPINESQGSLVFQIEAYVAEKVGERAAGKIHIGRSRIDQEAAVSRLHAREKLLRVASAIIQLQERLLMISEQHTLTLMPGYTHLQHAQPWTFGHYLLSHFYVFHRDFQRLRGVYERVNLNPLGTAALAGTSWPLDRYKTMEFLGFDDLIINSKDAGCFAPDYLAEIVGQLGILMSNLSRLCGDIYVWSSYEFKMVEVADEYCGSSSIMPQKKNAESLERVRALAGDATGWLASVLGTLKMCTSTDCDPYFVDLHVSKAADDTYDMLDLMTGVMETLKVDVSLMRERSGIFWSTTSNLADAIVRERDLSFRTAHRIVGRLVQLAIEEGRTPMEVTAGLVDRAARDIIHKKLELSNGFIKKTLDPMQFIMSRVTLGSVNPNEVSRMIEDGKKKLAADRSWLLEQKGKIDTAKRRLEKALNKYIGERAPAQT